MKSLLLILLALLGSGSCFKPVRVGGLLPSGAEAGSVSGLVFLLDHTTLYIRDFQFQVQGTDGNFCAGSSTSNVSDAFIITGSATPSPFTNGYSSSDIELTLPDGVTVAQLAWFGVCNDSDTTNVLASAVILPGVISIVPCNATFIGELPSGSNGIAGRVYLLDRITFVVIGFSYDGGEPDAFFWVGAGDTPSISGNACPYGDDVITSLPAFSDQDVVVHVPPVAEGTEISHFALYCRSNNVGLVTILVPDGLIPIAPTLPPVEDEVLIDPLRTRAHGVRGNVFALNQKTLRLTNFHFDGNAPGARFYVVQGPSVSSPNSWIVPYRGSTSPLGSFSNETVVLTLPDPITIHDIDWFSVWCVPFTQNFGEVRIPDNIVVSDTEVTAPTLPPIEECEELEPEVPVNCQQLTEDITVSWSIDSTNDIVLFQLCGCVLPDNYIAFGISGNESMVQMVGADVTWTWLDNEGVHAGDMDLTKRAQCLMETQPGGEITQSGACPDVQDDVSSVSGFRDGCTTCIKFARPLVSSDPRDKPFSTDGDQFMIWSMGPVGTLETPLGNTILVPFRHFDRANPTDDLRVNLSRSPVDQCNLTCSGCEVVLEPWPQPVLEHTTTIRAQIGQSGSERGYTGITGTAGWGIAWYLNGMLIPRVTVFRGTTYTFITEGGEDTTNSARYHPFYITDNERGGYLAKSPEEQQAETLYAGFDGETPLGVGRYCEYNNIDTDRSREFETFDAYLPTLVLECDDGGPGMFTWTPDENTPDTVYYQCATHQFLGYEIEVMDAGFRNSVSTVFLVLSAVASILAITLF